MGLLTVSNVVAGYTATDEILPHALTDLIEKLLRNHITDRPIRLPRS